ncbi:MAG TPA: hypothetical protein VHE78_08780 [Gemmatimonadaceae bacterium]|nr:hypothetical protein [Gemmatimonadaceae bacterium]
MPTLLGQPLGLMAGNATFSWFHLSPVEPLPSGAAPTATFRPSGERFHDRVLVELALNADETVRALTLSLHRRFIDTVADNPFARDIASSLLQAAVPDADRKRVAAFHSALNDFRASGATVLAHASAPLGDAVTHGHDPAYEVFLGERRTARIDGAFSSLSVANHGNGSDSIWTMTVTANDAHAPEREGGRPPENLFEFLSRRARRASDGRLVLDVALGSAVSAALLIRRPPGWRLWLSVAVVVAAFGAWGMADRELGERPHPGTGSLLLRGGRALAGVVGWLAFIAFVFGAIRLALGTWIS